MADTPTPRRLPPIELPPPGSGDGRRRRARADVDVPPPLEPQESPRRRDRSPRPTRARAAEPARPDTEPVSGPAATRSSRPEAAPASVPARSPRPETAPAAAVAPDGRLRVDPPPSFAETPQLESRHPRPAGTVLVIMVIALLSASLLDAPAMRERAENKPFDDPWRAPSVTLWGGLAWVSETLRLDTPRRSIDAAIGRDNDGRDEVDIADLLDERSPADTGTDAGLSAPTSTSTTTRPVDTPPTMRVPTLAEPLRVYVGGDSVSTFLTRSMQRIGGEIGVIQAVPDTRVETGLSRPDYFNWPQHLADDVVPTDPEVVVLFLGANDGQGLETRDGQICQRFEQCWIDEYQRRVAGTMDLLRDPDGDRIVLWLGLPPFKENTVRFPDTYSGIYAAEAATRPWVVYVDLWNAFADEAGQYAPRLPDAAGALSQVREADGIHLTPAGGDRMAWEVIRAIGDVVDLSAWTGVEPAGQTAPTDTPTRPDPPEPTPGLID